MLTARDKNGGIVFAMRSEKGHLPEAFCPCCKKPLLLRAGNVRRAHWAHLTAESCDEWWEKESEWRNKWVHKLCELPNVDIENVIEKDGAKHFYDARFNESLVVICRRKKIPANQLINREDFFGDMVWLVDGRTSEYQEYVQFMYSRKRIKIEGILDGQMCKMWFYPNSRLFNRWRDSQRPVVFDFLSHSNGEVEALLCMLPRGQMHGFVFLVFSRESFMEQLSNRGVFSKEWLDDVNERVIAAYDKFYGRQTTSLYELVEEESTKEANNLQRTAPEQVLAPIDEEALRVRKEMLITEYRGLGFSEADAIAKANLKLESERN